MTRKRTWKFWVVPPVPHFFGDGRKFATEPWLDRVLLEMRRRAETAEAALERLDAKRAAQVSREPIDAADRAWLDAATLQWSKVMGQKRAAEWAYDNASRLLYELWEAWGGATPNTAEVVSPKLNEAKEPEDTK